MTRIHGATVLLSLFLLSCSQNNDGDNSGSGGPGTLKRGEFHDAAVQGLSYAGAGIAGLTGETGEFDYRDGSLIRFTLGDIELGAAMAAPLLTPLDLAGADTLDTAPPAALNIARLLLTLDRDCRVSNGIQIHPAARLAGQGRTLDFAQPHADFAADPRVGGYLSAVQAAGGTACPALASLDEARDHLADTLDHIEQHGAPNRRPTAGASGPAVVTAGEDVQLVGTGSDTDGTVRFDWTQIEGPSVVLDDPTAPEPRFTAPNVSKVSRIIFELTVTDDDGATDSARVSIRVEPAGAPPNRPPVAEDQAFTTAEDTPLQAQLAASDPDGDPLSFEAVVQPSQGTLELAADGRFNYSPAPNFFGKDAFRFRVSDGRASSGVATVTLTVTPVNDLPLADAGEDRSVPEQSEVTLDGTASADPDGEIASYQWTQDEDGAPRVELEDANTPVTRFFSPPVSQPTGLGFTLTVTDDDGATGSDGVSITVLPVNAPPVADAGPDQSVFEAAEVQLDGSASADSDGEITTFTWEQVAGPAVELDDPASPTPRFTAPLIDSDSVTLGFRLKVTDDEGASDSDRSDVFVRNVPLGVFRVGAAKRSVSPSQAHIDGIVERRLGGSEHLQKFNLGGFGVDPTQNFPDPIGAFGDELTDPAEGPAYVNSFGETEHTWLRALAVSLNETPTEGETVVFLVLDAVGAGNIIQNELKARVAAATGLPEDRLVFGQTHSHAGADLQGLWGGVPQDWIDNTLYAAAVAAVENALAGREAATLRLRQDVTQEFNNYRRPRVDPDADADGHMTLLEAVADDGRVLGSILQYNGHPTSINEDPRLPHADYILGAVDWLEDPARGGGVALYFNGPIADASSSGSRAGCSFPDDGEYGKQRCKGEGMAEFALGIDAVKTLAPTLEVRSEEATLPVTNPLFVAAAALGSFNRYYDFFELPLADIPVLGPEFQYLPQVAPVAFTPVNRITLGGADTGLEIVTIPGEATNSFGRDIRALADPDATVMFLGLTQNSFGYIIPEEEFSYVEPGGDDGFLIPFTNYEEFVSLGPLTAPLLRLQAYLPLFGKSPGETEPNWLQACADPADPKCILNELGRKLDFIQRSYAGQCRAAGGPEEFCGLLDPNTGLGPACREAGFGDGLCSVLGEGGDTPPGAGGADLLVQEAEAQLRGCDPLDPAHCLYPFPSDHFTVAAAPDTIQSAERGGSGRRINFNPLAMPRNSVGKPIDPSEWNRNDGYSPGQLITAYLPGLAHNPDGTIPGAPPITDIGRSLDAANSAVLVIDAETGQPHPVWAEIDLNAGLLLPAEGVANPLNPKRPALLIRPASNFAEGRRYVVVLRQLRDADGELIPASAAFAACRDEVETGLPGIDARCEALSDDVFPVLDQLGIPVNGNNALQLAWDFTVASAENNIARLRHMRDDAFGNVLGQVEDESGAIVELGAAPGFTVDKITLNPKEGIAKRIEGTFTVPSYVVPADPALMDDRSATLEATCRHLPQADFESGCEDFFDAFGLVDGGSLPPNRLNYNPLDAGGFPSAPVLTEEDPQAARYGDGLPDQSGTMTTRYTCQIPAQAGGETPARPGIYGHGLLDGHQAVTYDRVPEFSREHNFLFCGADLFGFATGDVPNVLSVLVDLSNFPVIPDASQQGLLNYLFLARLLHHPEGFAAHPEFQEDGRPVFDRSEVFYDGNSQGGIIGGPVVALSKDVRRGVLGVVGMNYSTLLRRSVDFDNVIEPGELPPYALPLYLSYTDDLDRNLGISLIQMLWDRSENNGYAHHITDNAELGGPDNQVLLHPAFADHQVTHWSAQVMARTIGVGLADLYHRFPNEGVPHSFNNKFEFFDQRDPDIADFWDLPLVGRDAGVAYDDPACQGDCRTATSALIEFDQGLTAIPPIGNVPPRADDFDPHGYPRDAPKGKCQKSHFLHPQGRIVDTATVGSVEQCPPVAPPTSTDPQPEPPEPGLLEACQDPLAADCPLSDIIGAPEGFFEAASQCSPDESGFNCLFNAAFDHLGGDQLAMLVNVVADACISAGDACSTLDEALPDALPGLSRPVTRGSLIREPAPAAKQGIARVVDGAIDDWTGESSMIGGAQHFSAGEHIYTDFLYDNWGADDGDDARRLALLGPVIESQSRVRRIDQLQQAGGDQLGVPGPFGASDHYGDGGQPDGSDLHELRWATSGERLHLLATFSRLSNPQQADLLLLIDRGPDPAGRVPVGEDLPLSTARYDLAIRVRHGEVRAWNIADGSPAAVDGVAVANATNWINALEAGFERAALAPDGTLRVAAVTLVGGQPANLAYRYDEPVAGIYNEQNQALALLAGDLDGHGQNIALAALDGGTSETVRPGPGYHERQFHSGDNIAVENGELARLQRYGLYVPEDLAGADPTPISYWLHYRGGKAHSGAAWTPRLITELGINPGHIVATPHGRGTSSWYTTDAHQDVFEVMADVEALLPVDTRRRYLSGYSMGGYGTYLFGLLYPDLFAAGYSTSGAPTQGAWTGIGPDNPLCEGATNPCFIQANGGDANAQLTFRLLENAQHLPLAIHHGTNDELVPYPGIERYGLRLAELGYRHDMLSFIGYEHFSQAAVDEWAEGARYMHAFATPENPREVRYTVVPALVDAVNTVKPDPADASFDFAPDGAFWVDELIARDIDPADPRDTSVRGSIRAESQALPGDEVLTAPRTGLVQSGAGGVTPNPGTPVVAAGHSTPFVRQGLDWIPGGEAAQANTFSAELTGLSHAALDVVRMRLDFAAATSGTVSSDGPLELTLDGVAPAVDVYIDGEQVRAGVSGRVTLELSTGNSLIETRPAGADFEPGEPEREPGPLAQACLDAGGPAAFCTLLDSDPNAPGSTLGAACRELGGPEELCQLASVDKLLPATLDSVARGCDPLDPAHCMYPFPSNHFTTDVLLPGAPQSETAGGTGRRINMNPLGMPRNIFGKPIDPTEWNRNDGFSPGAMILAYVPGLAVDTDADGNPIGPVSGAVPITRLEDYTDPDAPVVVLNAESGERHPIWVEIDLNAGELLPSEGVASPKPAQPALIIRPARNFEEATRYVVALRELRDADGRRIPSSATFRACRDDFLINPLLTRCTDLQEQVFPVLDEAGIEIDASLYLAWDFTVASERSLSHRLLHMRDDAFGSLGETMDRLPGQPGYALGRAPTFTVDTITENPRDDVARRIEGTITVPSYVVPADPSPLESPGAQEFLARLKTLYPEEFKQVANGCDDVVPSPADITCDAFSPDGLDFAATASAPPNRLFYNPADNPANHYPGGDDLPDRPTPDATMTKPFVCNIPHSALGGKDFANATAADVNPARPSLYGHGLLGSRSESNNSQTQAMANLHNMMFCAVDWFGFAGGDLANIATILVDVSNMPVLPDASQQGMLNMLFLARALRHPDAFAAHPAFRIDGQPVFNAGEVYYDGNSQGGIMGGPIVAVSRDVNRGVLGVPGMNYSTLLRRSVDFDPFSIPLYLSYPDDLDRNFIFSLMEMLWERAENNGYAHHLGTASSDNTPLPGSPDNEVLLHVGFGDHQVTMWSADVMARTIHAGVDRQDLAVGDRHPDEQEFALLDDLRHPAGLAYDADGRYRGSALVYFDEPWVAQPLDRCAGNSTAPPPIGNVPPRGAGNDPHECPRREPAGRCQKSHFLQPDSAVLRVDPDMADDAECPAIGPLAAPPAPGEPDVAAASPGVDDVCAAYGIPGSDPACNALRNVTTALEGACAAGSPAPELCSAAGGNLHAAIDACYASNSAEPDAPLCRTVDAFVLGAAAICRQAASASQGALVPEVCALAGGTQISEREIQAFEGGWAHRALDLQDRLGQSLPLKDDSLVSTHNSYNATDDNTPPTLSGLDANQLYAIPEQLRMGVRGLEIDVHWTVGADGSPATNFMQPTVCHGLGADQAHFGCTTERPLDEVLWEIRGWLDNNPAAVLVIDIEPHLEDFTGASDPQIAFDRTAAAFMDALGERIFQPSHHDAACDEPAASADPDSWLNVSREQIRAAGRQVLMYSSTCGLGSAWPSLFHEKNSSNLAQGQGDHYANIGFPACEIGGAFDINEQRDKWTRTWFDSTLVGTATGAAGAPITPGIAHELMRCGLNMPSLDQLHPGDGRLPAMVWSWAENEPVAGDCAYLGTDGRFHADDCGAVRPFACVDENDSGNWQVAGVGRASDGDAACPAGFRYSVPKAGHHNEALKAVAPGAVWLNYSRAGGAWLAGDRVQIEAPAPQPLRAGAAKRALRVPVGTPLGGYARPPVGGDYLPGLEEFAEGSPDEFFAELLDFLPTGQSHDGEPLAPLPDELRTITSPYATYSPPSRGYYDSLINKVVALYDGNDCVVLSKSDIIGMLDEVVQATAEYVHGRFDFAAHGLAGCNLREGLVMAANHTHGGPGALANHSTRYFWLAMDAYQPELFERLIADFGEAVIAALKDMRPARFASVLGQEADGQGTPATLNSFRRSRSPNATAEDIAKEHAMRRRLGVLRIDEVDGGGNFLRPLAVVMNYAAHGIVFDVENMFFSGDALAAAERSVEQRFDQPVVAMLVQNTGGDVSPRAGSSRPSKLQRIERFGEILAPQVLALWETANDFETTPDLRVVSQRVILSRERLGYEGSEYPYPWGGAQCNSNIGVPFVGPNTGERNPLCLPAPPPDPVDLADNGVAENGAFVPQDTRVTVAKIGSTTLLAQPGEPLADQGVRLVEAAAELGFDPEQTFIWGYAQDHVGYIMADDRESWELGDTEGTTTFWGWKQGGRLVNATIELLAALRDGTAGPSDEFRVDYFYRDQIYKATPRPLVTASVRPGRIVTRPGDIARFGTTTFRFEGGDPVIDLPRVRMERETAPGIWQFARRANGEAIDSYFEMHLEYELTSGAHHWIVAFEAPKDWPAGNYRFAVEGIAWQGGETEYGLTSDAFAVEPFDALQLTAPSCNGAGCEVAFSYAPQPDNYRLIDAAVNGSDPAPVRAGTVEFLDGSGNVVATADGPSAIRSGPAGGLVAVYTTTADGVADARGVDAFGNLSAGGATPPPPPPAAAHPHTGASLLDHCHASALDSAACDQLAGGLQPVVDGCAEGGTAFGEGSGLFGDEEARTFCTAVLTADLDAAIRLCDALDPGIDGPCLAIQGLADVLATRNPWLARRVLNISHRGGAKEFPENTLFAYAESLAAGSEMIEADIFETADGELVVIHDATVDRTTDGSGGVSEMTVDQLKALDAAYCFVPEKGSRCGDAGPFPWRGIAAGNKEPPPGYNANDFRIPTLDELLARFPDTLINIELKPDTDSFGSYEGKLAAALKRHGRYDDVIVASFLDNASATFKAQAPLVSTSVPTAQVALSVASGRGPSPGVTLGHEAFQVPVEFSGVQVVNREFVDDAHTQGLAVHVWTIDDCPTMVDLIELGVDGIMTDRPSLLQQVLDGHAPCQGTGRFIDPSDGAAGSIAHTTANLEAVINGLLDLPASQNPDPITGGAQTLANGISGDLAQLVFDEDNSLAAMAAALDLSEEGFIDFLNAGGNAFGNIDDLALALQPQPAQPVRHHGPAGTLEHFVGALHNHSGYSDGAVGTQPRDYYARGKMLGLDFMGGSEHSDNLDLPLTLNTDCLSADLYQCALADDDARIESFRKWNATLRQARAASDENYTAFRGFEWTSDRYGHINVFFSKNQINAKADGGYAFSMEPFWSWFATRPELGGGADGLAVFNHPGREDALHENSPVGDPAYAFSGLEHRAAADARMVGIEVFGKGSEYDSSGPGGSWLAHALNQGWHVGAVGGEDHHGTNWAAADSLPKTVLIARDRSEGALRAAMLERRMYAVAKGRNGIRIDFDAEGAPMGSRLSGPGDGFITISVTLTENGLPFAGSLELLSGSAAEGDYGIVADCTLCASLTYDAPLTPDESWVFLRALGAGGNPVAFSSPVWLRQGGAYPQRGEWVAGDLHLHTSYGHDSYAPYGPTVTADEPRISADEVYTIGHTVATHSLIAARRGLDYLAITDHNDLRSADDPAYGAFGVIPIPGYENSLDGHAQMLGAREVYADGGDVATAATMIRADGGLFQINHPANGSTEFHHDADWGEARDGSYQGDTVPDTVEVWNIHPAWQPPLPSGHSLDDAMRYWQGWLDRGERVAITGGSDNHFMATVPVQGAGQPTTWVFVSERSERGVLEGLKSGRSFVSHQPPLQAGPLLQLLGDGDGDGRFEARIGDTVESGARFRADVRYAPPGSTLRIVGSGGNEVRSFRVLMPATQFDFDVDPDKLRTDLDLSPWLRAELVAEDFPEERAGICNEPPGMETTLCRNRIGMLAVTSAIFFADPE